MGRRWGAPGSAFTIAAAACVGSVKGEVLDTAGKVTATPDLMAVSIVVKFKHNRRPWVAFQIGFDFTDN